MVICGRCGKDFSTLQALHYHMFKKKVKCNITIRCKICFLNIKSKNDLYMHKCEPFWQQLTMIFKSHKNMNVFILDADLNTIFSSKNEDFCKKFNFVNQNINDYKTRTLIKGNDNLPYYITLLNHDSRLILFEEPYIHPLYKKGFLTP